MLSKASGRLAQHLMDEEKSFRKATAAYERKLTRANHKLSILQNKLKLLQTERESALSDPLQPIPSISLGRFSISIRSPELVRVDSEIGRVKAGISSVIQDAIHLRKPQKHLISWISLVPPEIWASIFWFCLRESEDDYVVWKSSTAPFVFHQVCSTWRDTVLTTPALWASLSLRIIEGCDWKRQLHACLRLSGTVPLSLEIQWYPPGRTNWQGDADLICNSLLLHSARWKKLRLFLPSICITQLLNAPMPALQSLAVGDVSSAKSVVTLREVAPRLRSANFESIYQDPRVWVMPWEQLTSLRYRYCLPAEEALKLCKACPLLECASFRVGCMTVPPSPKFRLIMSRLKSLSVYIGFRDNCSRLFEYLTAPCLEELAITSYGTSRFELKQSIVELCARSVCQLRKISCKGLSADIELIECIERIDTVTEVVFNNGVDTLPPSITGVLAERHHRALN